MKSTPAPVRVGDRVRLRKPHPCGGDAWVIDRVGADIGLRCVTCGRRVLLTRADFHRQLKHIIATASHQTEGDAAR